MAPRRIRTDWKVLARRRAKELAAARALLAECDRVLTMVPAQTPPAAHWLCLFQAEYVLPLIKKLREQA